MCFNIIVEKKRKSLITGLCFIGGNMAKEFSKAFYNSPEWKRCRESYIAQRVTIDGGMCERCHRNLGYILHHKIKLNPINIKDPDVSLNHCRLEWVCKKCHDLEHFEDMHGKVKRARCTFDSKGNPIIND